MATFLVTSHWVMVVGHQLDLVVVKIPNHKSQIRLACWFLREKFVAARCVCEPTHDADKRSIVSIKRFLEFVCYLEFVIWN